MGDDEGRTSLGGVGNGTLNFVLCGGVNCGGGVVKDEDMWVGEKGSSECDALALSAGESHAAFPDDCSIGLVKIEDKVMCLCRHRS